MEQVDRGDLGPGCENKLSFHFSSGLVDSFILFQTS